MAFPKLHDNEIEVLRSSWRVVIAFWIVIAGIGGVLVKSGFLDFPATAQEVTEIRKSVDKASNQLSGVAKTVNRLDLNQKVTESQKRDLDRRLVRIEDTQKDTNQKIDRVIDLLLSREAKR